MLRKTAVKEGVDWDVMLPYLLLAYREVPQASTPLNSYMVIMCGGPLDVLSKMWQSSTKSEESVLSHVLSIRDKLEKMKCKLKFNRNGGMTSTPERENFSQMTWYFYWRQANYLLSGMDHSEF